MRLTWEAVNKKAVKKYEKLLAVWDVSANYRKYRELLKSTTPPCVPYLGLIGKDIWAIEENSKTMLKSEKGALVINFRKLKLLWTTITFVDTLQQYEYPGLEENQECAAYLASIVPMSESDAKKRSHELEPRQSAQPTTKKE